ncbi:MAG: Zn-ribbon domain-containing OB-fold protein [Aigarchaeota archaeon]|nr:Zn-ribbon domain-containing OB-fold protein [Candidatus Pelearchaeum maunauluense]
MSSYPKPLPEVTPLTKPFWEASKRGELLLQRCKNCSTYIWYPRHICINCGSRELEWVKASGKGKVYSYTIVRQVIGNSPEFSKEIPFVVAEIELDEGARICSNIVGVKPEDVSIGMPVEVFFEECTPEISLPKFKPAR